MRKPKQQSKTELIKKWLEDGSVITTMIAVELFDAYRLSAVIYKLKQQGMNINSTRVFDGHRTYSIYYLGDKIKKHI